MACPPVRVGCWVLMWLWALGADLKAMGQLGHLWKTSQWAVWMWDLMEFSPPNTTWQLEHLDKGKWQVSNTSLFPNVGLIKRVNSS